MTGATGLIDAFAGLHVLVVGDAMLDVYMRGEASRLCPEAAVPIVDFEERTEAAGGAANTALNLQALGARVSLLTVVGRDREGRRLFDLLRRHEIDTRNILVHPQRKTLTKERVVAGSQLVVRIDRGSTGPLPPRDEFGVAARLKQLAEKCDAIVLSDYDYGTIGPEVIATLAEMTERHTAIVVGDSKRLERFKGVRFTAVKPNYFQATRLLGACCLKGAARLEQMHRLGPSIFDVLNAEIVALTLDQDGALIFEEGKPPLRTFTEPHPHTQAAGAGDTYVAAMTLALAAGGEAAAAAELAAAAAAIVVAKDGTSCCTWQELKSRVAWRGQYNVALESLLPCLEPYRRRGQKIVLTNGCFDILHRGHITYLHQARALGDVLVVGVNSDESIRRLKGPERPINSLEDRMQVLAALGCVEHVIAFDDDTPHRLVKAIRPHIFVKGGDYTRDRLPEASLVEELGGRVEILPLVRERSTTRLISRIREVDGADAIRAVSKSSASLTVPADPRLT